MKLFIWLIGTNGSGKTTQAKMFHNFACEQTQQIDINNGEVKISHWGCKIAHVGLIGKNQCTGTDTLNTKEQIKNSFLKACDLADIVVVDGIMATGTWYDDIFKFKKTEDCIYVLVNLHYFNEKEMIERLKKRRFLKEGVAEISDDTIEKIKTKNKGFFRLFEKQKSFFDISLQIDASLKENVIFDKILHSILKF